MRRLSAKRQAAMEAAERLDQAQLICFEAMEASTAKRRVALAEKALALSAHCADAYTILADHASSDDERLDLRRKAVAAGQEALGEDFDEIVGAFWMVLETRPFMRAKSNLASELWERGEKAAAIGEAQDMLRLNPNDNQGMRDYLAAWLAEAGRYDELERLLQDYREDSSAAWAWTRALLAYRKAGDGAEARKLLSKAHRNNPHVSPLLLGRVKMPKRPPLFYSPGEESEAELYVLDFAGGWRTPDGALEWLGAVLPDAAAKAQPRRRVKKPTA